jgi:hypothetical protein
VIEEIGNCFENFRLLSIASTLLIFRTPSPGTGSATVGIKTYKVVEKPTAKP